MIKLIYKLSLLLVLIGGIGEIAWHSIGFPFYWGNTQLNTKLEILKEEQQSFNTYFIGSSITFRQVIPSVFDSLSQGPTKSLNLGVDGCFLPQVFMLLDELMKDTTIKYLFVELNSYDHFGPNFRVVDNKYYLSPKWLSKTIPYLWTTSISLVQKVGLSGMYVYAYLEKSLGLGMRADFIKQTHTGNRFGGYTLMGKNKDGFYKLTGEKTKKQKELKELPPTMKNLKAAYQNAYKKPTQNLIYNKVLSKQWLTYLQLAESHGIHLFFVLNAVKCVLDSEEEMLGLFYQFPKKNRIDLANPDRYPAFYEIENRWDISHLNTKGATIFSKELAVAFNEHR